MSPRYNSTTGVCDSAFKNSVFLKYGLWIMEMPLMHSTMQFCVFLYESHRISFGCCGRYSPADVLAVILSFCIVCVWIMTGHWLLMDGN